MSRKGRGVIVVRMPSRLNWITTFCDMLTILLCFFVLIISMSSMESKALRKTFGFFNIAAGVLQFPQKHEINPVPAVVKTKPNIMQLEAGNINRSLMVSLKKQNITQNSGIGKDLGQVQETSRGFVIEVPDNIVFDKASATLRKDAEPVLKAVANALKGFNVLIAIEGHTDNSGNESANVKLSLQRAISIADFFVYNQGISPDKLCVAGYGSARPAVSNETDSGKAKNRRVEIVLMKDRI